MGIKLDWEIEAEQSRIERAGEDPVTARQRRRARLRLLLFVLALLAAFAGIAALIDWRLRAADAEIEQALRGTVDAEIAALRIDDWNAFAAVQRSASDDWLRTQRAVFDEYQRLKLEGDVQLTGQIQRVTVDDNRARVEVQEIIGGVPYSRIWFYWRYDDGWRHVPPDYTFWGAEQTLEGQSVTVRYRDVDEHLAAEISQRVGNWLQIGCGALDCNPAPLLTIEILPDEGLQVSWSPQDPWTLLIPSPYVHRARSDMPFDLELQFKVAGLLAERLVSTVVPTLQPVYPADVYYLRSAVVSWLVGRFVQLETNAFVIGSLAQNYGDAAVGRLLRLMQPDANAGILAQAANVPSLEQANLDWRDFLTWRLVTEDDLIRQQNEQGFLSLYDTRDEAARILASERFSAPAPELKKVVVSVTRETDANGLPVLRAVANVGEGEAVTQVEVLFRLVEGTWRRAN